MKKIAITSYLIFLFLIGFSQNPQDTSTYSDCKTYTDTIKICENSSVNFQEFSYSNTLTPLEWKWWFQGANPDTSIEQNPTNIVYNKPGFFNVKCSTVFELKTPMWYRSSIVKCMMVEVIELKTFDDIPIKDTTMCFGDILVLDATINQFNDTSLELPNINYLWTSSTPGTLSEPFIETSKITIDKPGFYKVRIFTNCERIEKEIEVKYKGCILSHFIPNAFSPNEDGLNDVYRVNVDNYSNYELKIYNRWGELIFKSYIPLNGWDGYYNNELCETEVYAVFVLIDNKIYSTNVHLLR
jgi:gliding motility-associated-like protein